jgi:hypothetical protein
MIKTWMNLAFSSAMLYHEAQHVIGLRTLKLARGGALGQREAQLMVTEKGVALAEAIGIFSTGGSAEKVLRRYRKRIRANKRRLSRR